MNRLTSIIFGLLLTWTHGFQNIHHVRQTSTLRSRENVGFCESSVSLSSHVSLKERMCSESSRRFSSIKKISSLLRKPQFDTIRASGLKNVHTAGASPVFMFGINTTKKLVKKAKTLPQDVQNMTWSDVKPVERIKKLHGPITYFVLSLMLGRKYPFLFKNNFYWLWVAFCIKWYRARYVFKIPVWDRQPNWNNVITSKEQEKDLKAYTCKNCGSTIFIAKTREFFFEGSTGIGGLGCFACGAKGADNFVMDRDRIVEDVADIDDYFEYERPLDFISAAERRKVLRETGGDEDAANLLLIERENAKASDESQAAAEAVVNGSTGTMGAEVDDLLTSEAEDASGDVESEEELDVEAVSEPVEEDGDEENEEESDVSAVSEPVEDDGDEESEEELDVPPPAPKKVSKPSPSVIDDDDMDILDMDAF